MRTSASPDGPLAVLLSRVRLEERLILEALEHRNVPHESVDDRTLVRDLASRAGARHRGVLNRIMSHTRSLYAARLFEAAGQTVFNSADVIDVCGDKLRTSLALVAAGVPTPRTVVALTPDAALRAVEEIGYPAVLKPLVGSWGRLLSKVNDRDAAETVIEHRQSLRSPQHSVFYVQEFIDAPGRDIRALVLGERVVAAVYRASDHWITNTARGATTRVCEVTPELAKLARAAADAVGGGMLAVDLIERRDGEVLVTEVNHTMEFHGLMAATGLDVAGLVVDHVLETLRAEEVTAA
ncbi:lysine biosynthesis protein LysX [Streptomyces sp. SPB074]|uniref:lysine biosynthesis protein LysX n=1 Tax=Streptomyces sp. (strain SPB074) TaxID=465543 RepID=UPI000D0AACF0|nr:lysine biosynthesis protein LysX [Streptomyces sp. SPB074]